MNETFLKVKDGKKDYGEELKEENNKMKRESQQIVLFSWNIE